MEDFTRNMIKDLCGRDREITPAQVRAALDILSGKVPVDGKQAAKECPAQLGTFQQAAQMIGCSAFTVRRMVKAGQVKAVFSRGRNRVVLSSVRDYLSQLPDALRGTPGVKCGKRVA